VKPTAFDYHPATSTDEAVGLLSELEGDVKVLAGGQSLVPLLALRLARVDHLIDVNRVPELAGIRVDGGLRIGAVTRHRTAEMSPAVARHAPLLAAALGYIGHTAIRTRGTIGGSLAHADPAAELPAALLALGGSVKARSRRGTRTIEAADLFTGFLTTSLEPDELLTEVVLPPWRESTGWSVQEFCRRSGDFAIAGAAATLSLTADGRVAEARIALIGVAPTAIRATGAEEVTTGQRPSGELWAAAADRAIEDLDPPSDLHGSAAYRRQLSRAMVRRALSEAAWRAGGLS
jgi:CO/xanthine dehydrogenase FAD-binding subunit